MSGYVPQLRRIILDKLDEYDDAGIEVAYEDLVAESVREFKVRYPGMPTRASPGAPTRDRPRLVCVDGVRV